MKELGEEGGSEEALQLSELEGLVWLIISVGRVEEMKSTHGIPSRPARTSRGTEQETVVPPRRRITCRRC
jgi:hypothetical protein